MSHQPCELGWEAEPGHSAWIPFHRKCLERNQAHDIGDIINIGDTLRGETCHLVLTNCRLVVRPEMVDVFEQLMLSSSNMVNPIRGHRLEGPSGSGKSALLIFIMSTLIQQRKTFLYFNFVGTIFLISPEGVYTRPTFDGYETCLKPLHSPDSPRPWVLIDAPKNEYVDFPLELLAPELFPVYAASVSCFGFNHEVLLNSNDLLPLVMKPWNRRELQKYLAKLVLIHRRRVRPSKFSEAYVKFGPDDRDIMRSLCKAQKGKRREDGRLILKLG